MKAFGQQKVSDFEQNYSPVGKMLCVLLGMAANMNLEIEQVYVKTAFLHGDTEEDIYMEQPEGFTVR